LVPMHGSAITYVISTVSLTCQADLHYRTLYLSKKEGCGYR
jgi:hypothetical protein